MLKYWSAHSDISIITCTIFYFNRGAKSAFILPSITLDLFFTQLQNYLIVIVQKQYNQHYEGATFQRLLRVWIADAVEKIR